MGRPFGSISTKGSSLKIVFHPSPLCASYPTSLFSMAEDLDVPTPVVVDDDAEDACEEAQGCEKIPRIANGEGRAVSNEVQVKWGLLAVRLVQDCRPRLGRPPSNLFAFQYGK